MKMQRIIIIGQILTLTLMSVGMVRGLVDLGYLKLPWRQGGTANASEVRTAGKAEVPVGGDVSRSPSVRENHGFFRQLGAACTNVWSKVTGAVLAVHHFFSVGWERLSGAWNVLLGRTRAVADRRTSAGVGATNASPAFLPMKKVEMKKVWLVDESAARHTVRHHTGRGHQYTTQAAASAR